MEIIIKFTDADFLALFSITGTIEKRREWFEAHGLDWSARKFEKILNNVRDQARDQINPESLFLIQPVSGEMQFDETVKSGLKLMEIELPVLTVENFYQCLEDRRIKDLLNDQPHPKESMDQAGYTYLDYVLYKTKAKPLKHLIQKINQIIHKGAKVQYYL